MWWLKYDEDFINSTKYLICDNTYVDGYVKVGDQRLITETYRCSAHRDCNINVKLNHAIPILFHSVKIMIPILLYKN